jgi:glutamate synthase (NADPH/NADH) small chain
MGKPSLLSPLKAIKYLFKKPKTLRYPFEPKEPAQRYRGLHVNEWEKCTGCGNCKDICPNEAIVMVEVPDITPKPGEKNERPQIDYGRCCFCGLCVDVCPPGCLRLSRDYFHIHFDTKSFTVLPQDDKTDTEHFLPAEKYSIFKASLTHRKKDYDGFSSDLKFALFDPERVSMSIIDPDTRKKSFVEMVLGYSEEDAQAEASRCLECKLCEDACPAHLKIHEYVKAIALGNYEESLRKVFEDNPIPAICGRICMKHCEDACSIGIRGEPLAIRWLKRFVADEVVNYRSALRPDIPADTGNKIAVIGAGPAGLTVAYFLRLKGHQVTVYDAMSGGGGMLRTGPPGYRLPIDVIDRDVNYIKSLGVKFKFKTEVGKDIKFKDIYSSNDAVFISTGMCKGRFINLENESMAPQAIDFLAQVKSGKKVKVGKNIIIIGGGNVAMDVARTCVRLQKMQYPRAKTSVDIVCLESWDIIPATEEEHTEAKEEGVRFNVSWGPKEILLKKKKICGLECKAVQSVFDDQGRFAPTFYEEKIKTIEGDMIIEAVGQMADFSYLPERMRTQLKIVRGKVQVDKNGQTSILRIFAGGDIVNRNLDAVTAIADAKKAVDGIEKLLSKKKR